MNVVVTGGDGIEQGNPCSCESVVVTAGDGIEQGSCSEGSTSDDEGSAVNEEDDVEEEDGALGVAREGVAHSAVYLTYVYI